MIPMLLSVVAASDALKERRDEVNKLNVFPVPDGDTGTNMSLTMEMVVKEISALPDTASLADMRKAITHGSLMGARGNSGVITSQILRGICEGLEGAERFDTAIIAKATACAVEVSFQAVRKPVEGTILTVIKDVAEAAEQADDDGLDTDEALTFIAEAAFASVRRTPELLPVLKENGVVDAGGFGLAILIEAFASAVTGAQGSVPDISDFSHPEPKVAIEGINDWAGSKFMYCTEFLFHAYGLDKDTTHDFLAGIGDCELLVGEEPDYKVHVHTDVPGTVLTYMTDRGQVSEVHVHNMKLQSEERAEGIQNDAEGIDQPSKPLGFVAVAAGSGMASILESLGVDIVVAGGQTMNPSTADILKAANEVPADNVIILPDNKNIIMAAQAACSASDKHLKVVPTKSVPEAFSAMFCVDPEASLDENVENMTSAIADVSVGEVTTAIKDAKAADGSPIHDGDVIGISSGAIEVVGDSIDDVTFSLVDRLCAARDADTITILAGEDLDDEAFERIVSHIEEAHPDLDVDQHRGEQPLYPIVMSVE